MAFFTLNGTPVRVNPDAAREKEAEFGADRARMFDGRYRLVRRNIFREWNIVTAPLTIADANILIALLKTTTLPLALSGDIVANTPTQVIPLLQSTDPLLVKNEGFRRRVTFTLYETLTPAPVDATGPIVAFWRRGYGYMSGAWTTTSGVLDLSACTPVAGGAGGTVISVWKDQIGTAHFIGGMNPNFAPGSNDTHWDPTLDADNRIRFGQGIVGSSFGGVADGRSYMTHHERPAVWFAQNAIGGEIMFSIQAVNGTPTSNGKNRPWNFGRSGSGSDGPTLYPGTNGHIQDQAMFGGNVDVGDVSGIVDLGGLNVVSIAVDLHTVSPNWTLRINNNIIYQTTNPSVFFPHFDGTPIIGGDFNGDYWDGWFRDGIYASAPLNDSQRLSWFRYMYGLTSIPPL